MPDDEADVEVNDDELPSCGETFQMLEVHGSTWFKCDRPAGHSGGHHGMPRQGELTGINVKWTRFVLPKETS